MDSGTIDEAALVMLIENHWQEFIEYSGGEESAETTLRALKDAASSACPMRSTTPCLKESAARLLQRNSTHIS